MIVPPPSDSDPDPEPQTPEQIREARRAVAVLSKREFCLKLLYLEVIPPEEVEVASRGEWPATFVEFTAGLPMLDAFVARIEWASSSSITYSHPMLGQLALIKAEQDQALATALLDMIFGIEA
jgi:hypothetical protein